MNIITLDFETYFDNDYSLRKMTTEAYIRDPRFEALGCAVKFRPDLPSKWWRGSELPQLFADIDWQNQAVLAHHAQFDGLILSHHYGVKPKFWFDTLSMARLLLGNHLSVGLESLAKHFELEAKTVPYEQFRGKRGVDITEQLNQLVGNGACHDVDLTWDIFCRLAKEFPREEYDIVDATVRMFTEPVLRGDIDLLGKVWTEEATSKASRLEKLGVSEGDLQSTNTFIELLQDEGVEPEYKPGKNGPIPACSKTDEFMKGLLEHDNERVRTLAEARLGVKSTLVQTRAATLGWMASRGPLPVYLRAYGAHTTRWSGGDSGNFQNLKRGSDLRRAIMAPDGFVLGVIDLAQIECRVLNHLAGEQWVLDAFREHRDLYCETATAFYGRPITKADKIERHLGKTLELGSGFGMGWKKLQATCRMGALGGPPIRLTDEEATNGIEAYRRTHPNVVAYWKTAGRLISRIAGGEPMQWGPMVVQTGRITGPNGTMLHYETLEYHIDSETGDKFWRYRQRHGWTKLYSGKLVENVVQWLARLVLSQALIRIQRLGYRVVNTTHDELLLLIPRDGHEEKHLERCIAEMKVTPDWLPGLPLDCEGSIGERYSK